MALPDLSGSLIQDTYQRVLHTDGTAIFDGTGSAVLSQTELASLQAIGSADISNTEWLEIAAIGNANITAAEWSYLSGVTNVSWTHLDDIDQSLGTANSPTFLSLVGTRTSDIGPAFCNASARMGIGFDGNSSTASIDLMVDRQTHARFSKGTDGLGHLSMSGDLTSSAIKIISNTDTDNYIEFYASNGTDILSRIDNEGMFQGTAASATNASNAVNATNIIAGSNAEDEEQFIAFLDNGDTGAQGIKYDGGIKYNPSKNRLTLSGGITGSEISSTGNISSSTTGLFSNVQVDTGYDFKSGASNIEGFSYVNSAIQSNQAFNVSGVLSSTGNISSSADVIGIHISASGDVVINEGQKLILDGNDTAGLTPAGNTYIHNAGTSDEIEMYVGGTQKLEIKQTQVLFNNGAFKVSGNITASGDMHLTGSVSASGNIYSNNTDIIQYSYQNENSQEADEWYGPNSQGPSYYYWAKKYSNFPDVGLAYMNGAFVLPYKAELVSCTYTVHCLSAFSAGQEVSYTASLLVRDSSTITFPVLNATNANANIDIQGQAAVVMDKQNGQYRIDVPVSGTYSEGSYVYPRTRVGDDGRNWRGNFALKIRRVE